jgi:hypothetical protein
MSLTTVVRYGVKRGDSDEGTEYTCNGAMERVERAEQAENNWRRSWRAEPPHRVVKPVVPLHFDCAKHVLLC